MSAALYASSVVHRRAAPVRHGFRYSTYLWFVDVDRLGEVRDGLPRWLRPFARIEARDHVGDPGAGIRQNIDAVLAREGIVADGRITMLTAARVLGYVFNPLTVYWCHDAAGAQVAVVAEVHNTYGERHCYVLRPDGRDAARVEKAFYVSPFEPVAGEYRMTLPEPGEELDLTITLHRPGRPPFVAGLTGRRRPLTARTLARFAFRFPLAPLVVTLRIRKQGIALWLKKLPIVARPEHAADVTSDLDPIRDAPDSESSEPERSFR